MYRLHSYCRACGYAEPTGPPGIKSAPSGEKLVEVFDLGIAPLANDFCGLNDEHAGYAPLRVLMCPNCFLAQLSVVVSPEILYCHNYPYVTSRTEMMFNHFKALWDCIWDRHSNPAHVIEIGSNDGTLLKFIADTGADSVIGIDPAENLCEKATQSGVRSICGLFEAGTAAIVSSAMPKVDVVIARHVFCHIDDWRGFIKNLDTICQKDTLVAIEVPYVMDLLNNVQFDTIYSEHLSYMNIKAMVALLDHTPFKVDHVQHFPIHGGAIVVFLRRRDFNGTADESVSFYVDKENKELNVDAWKAFGQSAKLNIDSLKHKVRELVDNGKTVCGFGASAKSTVWVDACGFTRKEIRFITDTTPQKQGKFSPGSDIPITDPGALMREFPEYAIVFCWNFLDSVLEQNQQYIGSGGKFIVPVPTVRIVP